MLFGTAAADLDRQQAVDYLALVVAREGTIRWEWETVHGSVPQST